MSPHKPEGENVSETYLSVGDGTGCFYLSNMHKGRVYVFGVRQLHPDNLTVIELGRRVFAYGVDPQWEMSG